MSPASNHNAYKQGGILNRVTEGEIGDKNGRNSEKEEKEEIK